MSCQDAALQTISDPLLEELIALEQRLHQPETRRDPTTAASLLAEDFREFGSSGCVYDKASILRRMAAEPPLAALTSTDYRLTRLSPEAALLTYQSTRAGLAALRSSLWVYRDRRWQMLFHQGTRISETAGAPDPSGPG